MPNDVPNGFPSHRRIVITGLGIVSPLGLGVERFWSQLTSPSATETSTTQSISPGWSNGLRADFAGCIDEFGELSPAMRRQLAKSLKVMNRETQLGVAAGLQALRESCVLGAYDPERIGVSFGAENVCLSPADFSAGVAACGDREGDVDLSQWGSRGLNEVAPLWLLRCLPNMPACHLAILANLQGPNNTLTRGELSTDLALAEACRVIRSGDADAMLVGGVGSTLSALNRLHAHWAIEESRDSADETPPLNAGSLPAEGSGAFVLEDWDSAIRRGAPILGEILATVSNSSGGPRRGLAGGTAAVRAARLAVHNAHLTPNRIAHINMPEENDHPMRLAAREILLDAIGSSENPIPVISARGQLGYAGAGSGAMELVASLLLLTREESIADDAQEFSSVVNVRDDGPACALTGDSFLKLSRDGRGQASCVAMTRVPRMSTAIGSSACNVEL